ncbi:MAG: methyl-coenzyme M reductase I operon protein C [Archaeoglobales archaeon]|nr:methyl-coenzyme M reductase I operon protein C [Archaeoglobales archaeon]
MKIGRETQFVDCREAMGIGLGGGLAQRGTISVGYCGKRPSDVVVISMSPSTRHVTKPVCEITAGLRREGINASVLVLNAGSSAPPGASASKGGYGSHFGLKIEEIDRIAKHKLCIIHLGNVKHHVVAKAKAILRYVPIKGVIVCQCPLTFEDLVKAGVKTRVASPENPETLGEVVEIVTDVVRGQNCPPEKIDEICEKVKRHINWG